MKKLFRFIVTTLIVVGVAFLNSSKKFVIIPDANQMNNMQINYIMISTVFIGFLFASLGLFLALPQSGLIDKIKNTRIIRNKIKRIMISIVYFLLSVVVSFVFVLGLDNAFVRKDLKIEVVDNYIYILGLGYMILGIIYFIYSIYEFYELLKNIYNFSNLEEKKIVLAMKNEVNKQRKNICKD